MNQIFRALRNRFDANRRLKLLGRRLYRVGEEQTTFPFVTVEIQQTEAANTQDDHDDWGRWTFTFTAMVKDTSGRRCAALIETLANTFEGGVYGGDAVRISAFRGQLSPVRPVADSAGFWTGSLMLNAWVEMSRALSYGT